MKIETKKYRGVYQCRICKQKVYTAWVDGNVKSGFGIFESSPLYKEHVCSEPNADESGIILHGLCDLVGVEESQGGPRLWEST